jgi:hypothetical protein
MNRPIAKALRTIRVVLVSVLLGVVLIALSK